MKRAIVLTISTLVLFINFIIASSHLATTDGNLSVLELLWLILSCICMAILMVNVIFPDMFIQESNSATDSNINALLGREVIVFDYELHANIGDLDDNEFYWKKGVIIKLHEQKDGYLVDVRTEDGRIVEEVGTNYLRNWK